MPRARAGYRGGVAAERNYARVVALTLMGVLTVIAIASWLLATPADEYVLLPDDPHLADPVVTVAGEKPAGSRDDAGIYYTDVLVHRASLPESWLSRFEDGATVLPAHAVVPPGGNPADLDRVDRLTFADSRTVAGVVALRALGREVTVERTGVTFDGVDRTAPSYRAGLRPGMVITAIDGMPVPQLKDLAAQMSGRTSGSPIRLSVLDGTRKLELRTKLTSDPDEPGRAIIGVLGVHDAPPRAKLPVKITISPRGLGRGPSAGLAFALEIYDSLGDRRLAKGRKIAVTGTIDLDGNVGPIGGVRQKVLGAARSKADIVLVPAANAADGRAAAKGRVEVIAVSSFRQALSALGAPPPSA